MSLLLLGPSLLLLALVLLAQLVRYPLLLLHLLPLRAWQGLVRLVQSLPALLKTLMSQARKVLARLALSLSNQTQTSNQLELVEQDKLDLR
jgi:hypothetical protein